MPFLKYFHKKLLKKTDSKLIIFVPQQHEIETDILPRKIELYQSLKPFVSNYFVENIFV